MFHDLSRWSPTVVDSFVREEVQKQMEHHRVLYRLSDYSKHDNQDWRECSAESCLLVYQSALNHLALARAEQIKAITNLCRSFQ